MERETGFEPATSTSAVLHSTTELFPLSCPRPLPDISSRARSWRRDYKRRTPTGTKGYFIEPFAQSGSKNIGPLNSPC